MLIHKDGQLQGNETLIQDAINGAPASVQAQANQLFSDYKTQVTNAQAQTAAAQQILPQLTPSAFNSDPTAYKTTFGSYKTDIQSAASGYEGGDLRPAPDRDAAQVGVVAARIPSSPAGLLPLGAGYASRNLPGFPFREGARHPPMRTPSSFLRSFGVCT